MCENNRFSKKALDECWQVPLKEKIERLAYQNTLRRFNTAVAILPYPEQNLFHLRYYQELPVQELAARYSLTTGFISRRLRRINSKLKQSD